MIAVQFSEGAADENNHSSNRIRGTCRFAARPGQGAAGCGQHRRDRHRRRGDRRERARGRRLGDRRDHRSADQIRQDRRDRRSGPLCDPRSAEGQLQRLGARLWPGRFAEGAGRARQDCSICTAVPAPNAAAAAQIYPPIYWFSMLHVPKKDEFPAGEDQEPGRVAQHRQERRLPVLPSARHAGDARRSARSSATQFPRTSPTPGRGASSRAARRRSWRATSAVSTPSRRSTCSAIGPTASRAASCPSPSPSGRRASSAMSSSPSGSGASRRAYLHDAVSTDRRNPRLNANGKIYGSPEDCTDMIPILDPKTNTASEVKHPVRDPKTPTTKDNLFAPSPCGATSRSGTARPSCTTHDG